MQYTGTDSNTYFTIEEEAQGEITEKKSRFICNLYHVENEDQIKDIVESLKKKHYQARHVCHAAILGDKADVLKYSDDGGTLRVRLARKSRGCELRNAWHRRSCC